jgi:hypothetical protein
MAALMSSRRSRERDAAAPAIVRSSVLTPARLIGAVCVTLDRARTRTAASPPASPYPHRVHRRLPMRLSSLTVMMLALAYRRRRSAAKSLVTWDYAGSSLGEVMRTKKLALLIVGALILVVGLTSEAGAAQRAIPARWKNCTAVHARFPHGVGLLRARDKTSGEPVTTFRRSTLTPT